jgi:hypothetical protein
MVNTEKVRVKRFRDDSFLAGVLLQLARDSHRRGYWFLRLCPQTARRGHMSLDRLFESARVLEDRGLVTLAGTGTSTLLRLNHA